MTLRPDIFGGKAFAGEIGGGGGNTPKLMGEHSTTWQFGEALL